MEKWEAGRQVNVLGVSDLFDHGRIPSSEALDFRDGDTALRGLFDRPLVDPVVDSFTVYTKDHCRVRFCVTKWEGFFVFPVSKFEG